MENYEIQGQIGKGSFGLVQKIKRKTDGKILVWKEMNYGKMSEREKQQLVAEVNIIRELRHPNIVRYYDRIIEKKDTKILIIMEYCEGGDMGTLLKKCKREKDYIAEDVIWKIFTQIVLALNECHNRSQGKILHRDLKPANIFLDAQNNIKLGDFGLSRVMGENSEFAKTHVGTPYYMSPEQIQECKYNEKSDIWSAGCLLYEMAALKPPFEATNHLSLAIKIKSGKFERLPLRYSEEIQKLIESMLNIDSEKRPSIQQLIELQQISLRLKEKKLREKHTQIKAKEDELKKLEEQQQERLRMAEKKEKEIQQQEQILKDMEEQVQLLEKQQIIKYSKSQQDDDMFSKNTSGLIPQKSSRGKQQLLTQNLINFGKDLISQNRQSNEQSIHGNESKNSSTASQNNNNDLYKNEKENLQSINNLQNTYTDSQNKEKEIQKSYQSLNNKYPIFLKQNSSLISQGLSDQLQQQNSIENCSPQNHNYGNTVSSQKGRIVSDIQQPPQSSCSSNSSSEYNTLTKKQFNNDKNYIHYTRKEQEESLQKTPINNQTQNYQNNNFQQSTEGLNVAKKNISYTKEHQYKSVDHFTSIQNNTSSNSKNYESLTLNTTHKIQPQSETQIQNTIIQSSNKSSHDSYDNLPKKTTSSSSTQNLNSNNQNNENQQTNSIQNNSNVGITAFEKYKAAILSNQEQKDTNISKYNQINQNQGSSKVRVQTSIDSASFRNIPDSMNYFNYRRENSSNGPNSTSNIQQSSAITRRSANNTLDSVKYQQINNSISNIQTETSNNKQNFQPDMYKQANMRRNDSYKENSFKNFAREQILSEQEQSVPKQQYTNNMVSNAQNQKISNTSITEKNGQNINQLSLEPKNRLNSQHNTSSMLQPQSSSSSTNLNNNKPPIAFINTSTIASNPDEIPEHNSLKTLPNTELYYNNINGNTKANNLTKIQNNSYSSTPSSHSQHMNININYLSNQGKNSKQLNNNYSSNQPISNFLSNQSNNNINQTNSGDGILHKNGDSSVERKKDFPIRPRNNYLLPQRLTSVNQQQNGDMNMKNYFSEQNNNNGKQDQQKYQGRKFIDQNIISPTSGQYNSNQYRTNTQY